jgi:translation initiation factor 5
MQEILDKFIKKYVLCPACNLPEINGKYKVSKKDLECKCDACGKISKLDSSHEFFNYIKKNPPPSFEEEKKEEEKKITKKEKEKKEKVKSSKESEKTLDKKDRKTIKDCSLKLPKIIKNDETVEKNIEDIKKFLGEYELTTEFKFYCFSIGIFMNELYTKEFLRRIPIIKHFLTNESGNKPNEALYYMLMGLQDLVISIQKGEYKKYVSSLLYYFYDNDIITEEFWLDYLKGKYTSVFNVPETEKKFKNAAAEFSDWIKSGPYEGEDDNKEEGEGKEDNKKGKKKGKGKKGKKKKDKEKDEEKEDEKKEDEKKEEKKEKKEDKKEDKEEPKDEKKEEQKEDKKDEKDVEDIDIDNI